MVQPNKQDKPNKPIKRDRPDRLNEQDRLTDFFSILLERMYFMTPIGMVTVPGWIARSLTGCHPVPIMPL
jgi:hypothetical protein